MLQSGISKYLSHFWIMTQSQNGWLDIDPEKVFCFHRRAAENAEGDVFLAFRWEAEKLKSSTLSGIMMRFLVTDIVE